MVTGASTADVAVILIDARKGVLTQTRRHSYLVSLLGIRHVVLAINKLDLVGLFASGVRRIEEEYRAFAGSDRSDRHRLHSAVGAEGRQRHVAQREHALVPRPDADGLPRDRRDRRRQVEAGPFRMPVQWVNRPNRDFRGFSGRIVGGAARPGDRVRVLPSGKESTVARIVTQDGDLERAVAGQSVTLTLRDEIDISRGDLLCSADAPAGIADQFEATIVWMSEDEMLPGRPYLLKIGGQDRRRDRRRRRSTRSTSTRSSIWPRRRCT